MQTDVSFLQPRFVHCCVQHNEDSFTLIIKTQTILIRYRFFFVLVILLDYHDIHSLLYFTNKRKDDMDIYYKS